MINLLAQLLPSTLEKQEKRKRASLNKPSSVQPGKMTGTILTASGAGNNSKAGEEGGMVQLSPLWHFRGPSLKALALFIG